MAVPPSYSDLGRAAKDIFSKGYGFGVVKLELKTKSESGDYVKDCCGLHNCPLFYFSNRASKWFFDLILFSSLSRFYSLSIRYSTYFFSNVN
uniref:Uncharacterized protein n=1 Tax=Mola mola TaxID=94237 RepID=A0A3Q3XHD9_MOLML